MNFRKKVAWLMIVAAIQMPCLSFAAEEDKELSLIAAEQERSADDERLDEINPALTETITTERTQETDKDKRERKKKLKQARKEKEKANEQKLKDSANKKTDKRKDSSPIEIAPTEPEPQPVVETKPEPQPVVETKPEPQSVAETKPEPQSVVETKSIPQPITTPPAAPPKSPLTPPSSPAETVPFANQKMLYANFAEAARAVHFVPLYMPRKSGYEITSLYAGQGIVEVRYGRRWEPTVSLTVRTYKRKDGEEPQDISGVTGVKWRVDTTTGTTIYVAKISETEQVAAWAVGHYTFSARAENLSYAGFYSLVADELVELSTHYYLDI
ncbi:MAG: hypothetical protein IJP42_00775 [Selenomonadaceae bacterium]|nr:hypothetical protein [Selenomonadaceae bacterium]